VSGFPNHYKFDYINLMHVVMKTLNWLYIHAQDDENKPRWKGDTFLVFWKATKFWL
jgi:hypothetical protein